MATASGRTPTPVEADAPRLAAAPPVASPGTEAVRFRGEAAAADLAWSGRPAPSLARRIFEESFAFDFFQAVRILQKLYPHRLPVGQTLKPEKEVVRFRAYQSLSFPASQIYEISQPDVEQPPEMIVTVMGLTGPLGALPRHYTELILRLLRDRDVKGPEKTAFRDWLDLFNHRLISLFYRAWEKYRFYIPYERGEYAGREPDPFTRCLLAFVGLEAPPLRHRFHGVEVSPLRNRLKVATWEPEGEASRERVLARVDDLALLHYSGFLAHRPRNAAALEALLQDYFQLPMAVEQFRGQWLYLERSNQSKLNGPLSNNELGINLVAGERVWDAQSKFRIRVGPLNYDEFLEFLPDRTPVVERKTFFLLVHLVRLYVGPELDFDVQLLLKAPEVPECQLREDDPVGARLGWNTWLRSEPMAADAEDVTFEGEEVVYLNAWQGASGEG